MPCAQWCLRLDCQLYSAQESLWECTVVLGCTNVSGVPGRAKAGTVDQGCRWVANRLRGLGTICAARAVARNSDGSAVGLCFLDVCAVKAISTVSINICSHGLRLQSSVLTRSLHGSRVTVRAICCDHQLCVRCGTVRARLPLYLSCGTFSSSPDTERAAQVGSPCPIAAGSGGLGYTET